MQSIKHVLQEMTRMVVMKPRKETKSWESLEAALHCDQRRKAAGATQR